MNQEVGVIFAAGHLVVPKRDIGNGKIHGVVGYSCFLETRHLDLCFWVEELEYLSADLIQFHAVKFGMIQDFLWHHAEEMPHSTGRF